MIPEAGQKFGPYEILSRLGSGAMGLVFKAWDARLHREVAIKLLHDDYQMPGMRERFLQEARAASALNHPNICTIFDLGEQDGEPYMVMELLEGETLKEKISRGAVPVDEIISYGQEVADALGAAHAKGIVHRDVKPANIFLVDQANGRKQAKVLDFGLAKIGLAMRGGRASRALDLTLAGATVGTLSYMSPEQARGQVLDERSDLFSLGVVMYEMATRQVPFKGATSALIFVQLLNHSPEPLHDWNDSIPKELEKIILKLLTKERDQRFQTANDLTNALRKIPFRSGGGWLKRAAAAVPLVRAADPVARGRRPVKVPLEQQVPLKRDSSGARLPGKTSSSGNVAAKTSSGDNMLIRPVARSPQRDAGGLSEGVLRGVRTVSDRSVAVKDESSAANEVAVVKDAPLPVPSPSSSGVTQFEFESEDVPVVAVAAAKAEAKLQADAKEKRARVRKPVARPLATAFSASPEMDTEVKSERGKSLLLIAALVIMTIAGVGYLMLSSRFRPVVLRQDDALLLTVIQNRTNDRSLDGVVIQGLELVLGQGQYLTIRGGEAYRAGLRQIEAEGSQGGTTSSRRVAQSAGAKAYLYGEIKGADAPYTISVDVLKTDSNDKLASIEEKAESKEQIAAAIGRVAGRVRSSMGESERTVAKSVSLEQEATSDLSALQAYGFGEVALQSGKTANAIALYKKAVAADPKFTQAHLRLAWLYRSQLAEPAAAAEAKVALEASDSSSDRLKQLAQFCYEMNVTGDYVRAAGAMKQLKELYPRDTALLLGNARVLRAQGHLPEALQAAQLAYNQEPSNGEAYAEAEWAMLGMDHAQGALQLEEQARRLGVAPSGITLAAAYLAGDANVLAKETAAMSKTEAATLQDRLGRVSDYGLYLDNQGRLKAGSTWWTSTANGTATRDAGLASAEPYLLAQAALDRALAKSCKEAASFAQEAGKQPMGLTATFDAGMAAALCGDKTGAERAVAELKLRFARSTAVTGYYLADLTGAIALADNDPKAALAALSGAAAYDQMSLTPYLRGLAHLESAKSDAGKGEAQLAVANFQIILDHRGAAFVAGSNVYPMAQIGLARAYASIGDGANSKAAYRRFAGLWHEADSGQAVFVEATAKGR